MVSTLYFDNVLRCGLLTFPSIFPQPIIKALIRGINLIDAVTGKHRTGPFFLTPNLPFLHFPLWTLFSLSLSIRWYLKSGVSH